MAGPQASITNGNNPLTLAKPNTDNQSNAVNSAAQPGSSTGGGTLLAQNPYAQFDTQSKAFSVATDASNTAQTAKNANTSSANDYQTRANVLNQNNNRQKVALVGRTGAGARALTSALGGTAQNLDSELSVVVFEATPDMTESGGTVLIDIGDIRAAASIVIYMGSPSRTFTLNAKFVSRTTAEAATNQNYINILKAWREPTIQSGGGIGQAEPETLRLFAYGDVLKGIPCMVNNISIEYPSDVDYIQATTAAGKSVWVPIIQNVSLTLKEVRSWDDLKTFDYESFKQGTLDQW